MKIKAKTNKSYKKRFKVTATGKVLRRKAGKKHLLSCKNANRRKNLSKWAVMFPADAKKVKLVINESK